MAVANGSELEIAIGYTAVNPNSLRPNPFLTFWEPFLNFRRQIIPSGVPDVTCLEVKFMAMLRFFPLATIAALLLTFSGHSAIAMEDSPEEVPTDVEVVSEGTVSDVEADPKTAVEDVVDTANEVADDTVAESVDETDSETADDAMDESVDEMTGESADDAAADAIDETDSEVADDAMDESVDEMTSETADDAMDESVDEMTSETADNAMDESVDEMTSETADDAMDEASDGVEEMAGESVEESLP